MEEYTPELVTVLDEDGTEYTFEILDKIETESGKYAALLPYDESEEESDDNESDELIILKVIEYNDEFYLEPIEDDREFNEIGEIFEERLSEFFTFDEDAADEE